MSGLNLPGAVAVVGVVAITVSATLLYRPRRVRRHVAPRPVATASAAMALSDEYLSGALIVGFAGLVLVSGMRALWLGVGALAGLVLMVALVAAPLRRSGAYTLSDFTEWRLGSRKVRRVASACVCFAAWVYLLPQLQGVGLTLTVTAGLPQWAGMAVVLGVVALVVLSGRTRAMTAGQALQFWIKLVAIAFPLITVLIIVGAGHRTGPPAPRAIPMAADGGAHDLYGVYSLLAAMILGTMGLPYLVLRLYTVPTARAVRRTLLGALGLLAVFLLLPALYGVLGRGAAPAGWPDGTLLGLPNRLLPAPYAAIATAVLVAGVLCAFVSATTAIVLAVAATIAQCVPGGGVRSFRLGAVIAVVVPLSLVPLIGPVSAGLVVPYAFAITAASLCPLLVLGIWWRRLTGAGAAAGMIIGAGAALACFAAYLTGRPWHGWAADVIEHPALIAAPLGFAAMWGVSLLTSRRVPEGTGMAMARMHLPEAIAGAATAHRDG